MKKLNKNKGFTLAELLIVVAVIAVLAAISIPVFTGRLETSREGTDIANLRSAYAVAQTDLLTSDYSNYNTTSSPYVGYYDTASGTVKSTAGGDTGAKAIGKATVTGVQTNGGTIDLPSGVTYNGVAVGQYIKITITPTSTGTSGDVSGSVTVAFASDS